MSDEQQSQQGILTNGTGARLGREDMSLKEEKKNWFETMRGGIEY